MKSGPGWRSRPWTLALALGLLAAVPVIAFAEPLGRLLPPCQFHLLTGLHCPGCGATRCVQALGEGDVPRAASLNIAFLGLLVAGSLALVMLAIREWTTAPRALPPFPVRGCWWIVGGLLVFGVLRNLPLWPFTWLAPP